MLGVTPWYKPRSPSYFQTVVMQWRIPLYFGLSSNPSLTVKKKEIAVKKTCRKHEIQLCESHPSSSQPLNKAASEHKSLTNQLYFKGMQKLGFTTSINLDLKNFKKEKNKNNFQALQEENFHQSDKTKYTNVQFW